MKAQFKFLSGSRAGQVDSFQKAYLGVGRHPLSDVRFDAERDLDVSARHAAVMKRPDGYILQDLGSKNGTFVNGQRVEGERLLVDGDVIGFGAKGPALEFHLIPEGDETVSEAASTAAARLSKPRQPFAPPPAPAARPPAGGSSTAVRIAVEVARQTKHLRTTTKVLMGVLGLSVALFGYLQWNTARERRAEVARMQAWADSVAAAARDREHAFQNQVEGLKAAYVQSLAEVERLRAELAASGGDAVTLARVRSALQVAQQRQEVILTAGAVDYRAISQRNQDAVALVVVEFSEAERFSGTAFALDSQGTMLTNKHVLVGETGDRVPRRIAVKFSGSRQWFPGRFVGVADDADIGVLKVDIRGGTPRVEGLQRDAQSLQRGDPVAVIGYPLGMELPMTGEGLNAVAEPTLTVGTASKVLDNLVQVDGYGAPGSSGSPIFDRAGRVVAVLYGGERESNGKIVFAVPAAVVLASLTRLGIAVR